MKLSVIFPAFRVKEWHKLYDSLCESFTDDFEMILVGPYKPDFEKYNMKWIEDWGCPTRCQQIGLLAANGEWLCFGWDDGLYHNGTLDESFRILKENNFDYKTVVIGRFIEGNVAQRYMIADDYYKIKTHDDARSPYFPDNFMIFSTGVISKKLLMEVGGFDSRFETMALSVLDLSIRLQFYGCNMILQPGVMMTCTWQPGNTGDHEPVNKAFYNSDMPLYHHVYRSPAFKPQPIVDINNYKFSPEKWSRRFS